MRVLVAFFLVALFLAGCLQDAGNTTAPAQGIPSVSTSLSSSTTTSLPPRLPPRWAEASWQDVPCGLTAPTSPPSVTPELVAVENRGHLSRYGIQADGKVNTLASTGDLVRMAVVVGRRVVSVDHGVTDWSLVARGDDLLATGSIAVPQVTAIATYDGVVFVATRWNLTAYDADLHVLGRVALDVPAAGALTKAVDSMAFADGYAYLLDDAAAPFVFFRVDVRDVTAMKVLFTQRVASSSTPHLQWLDREAGTWYVEENHFGLGNSSRTVVPVQMASGAMGQSITLQSNTFPVRADDPTPRRDFGYAIFDSTFTLPAWSILVAGNLTLSRVDVNGTTPQRSCSELLKDDTHLLQSRDLLLTYGRNHVAVWEVRDRVKLRVEALLPASPLSLSVMDPAP